MISSKKVLIVKIKLILMNFSYVMFDYKIMYFFHSLFFLLAASCAEVYELNSKNFEKFIDEYPYAIINF